MIDLWDARLPTADDWIVEPPVDEDYEWAYNKLFGKTAEEVLPYLHNNSLAYIEDLASLPPSAFEYYFKVLVQYLFTDLSEADCSAASSIFGLIQYDLTSEQNRSARILKYVPPILKYVASRQDFYDADIDLFGDLKEKANTVITLIEHRLKTDGASRI